MWRLVTNSSIRLKIAAGIVMGIAALTGIIFIVSRVILLGSYIEIEHAEAVRNAQRANDALNDLVKTLDVAAGDWSHWDDPYEYAMGMNLSFETTDLTALAMSNVGINTLVILDAESHILFEKTIDLESQNQGSSQYLELSLNEHAQHLRRVLAGEVMSGILHSTQGPLIFAAHPILHSDGSGPPAGALIFVKQLNESLVSSLEELTHLSIMLFPYEGTSTPSDVVRAKQLLTPQNRYITQPLAQDVMAAYAVVYDLDNIPILVLRIETSRPIYQQGLSALRVFVGFAGATSVSFGLILILLLEILVITRVSRLEREVGQIRDSHDLTKSVYEGWQDELGKLAREINRMLRALYKSEQGQRLANEKMIEADTDLKKRLLEIERMNAHMVDRELRMVELKKENAELRKNSEIAKESSES